MCHIICRRSTGITGKSGYLSRGRGINGKSCAPCGNRYGDGSRSAHTQNEMDIYVNNGGICQCQYDTSLLSQQVLSMSSIWSHDVIGKTDSGFTAESGSDQACRTRTTRVGSASEAARTMSTSASSRRLRSSLSALAISLSTDSPLRARSSPEDRNSGAVHAKSFVRLATARAVTTSKLM